MAAVLVIVLGIAAFFIYGAANPSTVHKHRTGAPTAMVTVTNTADGFSISYPSTWHQVADPAAPLLVVRGKTTDAMSVQVDQLAKPVNASNVAAVKTLTDAILASGPIQMKLQRALTLNKIPGYYYFYLDKVGTEVGAHAVYFLFQGRKMTILTFQALPYTDFTTLAATFDKIAGSYRSNPKILGPIPPSATLPPATTATTTRARKATTATTASPKTATTARKG